jgi:PEP-CTERM motif
MLFKTIVVLAVSLMLLSVPAARATTITLSDSEVNSLIFNTAVYQVETNNGGNLANGHVGFTAPVDGAGPEALTAAGTTLVLSGYSIPSGAILNSATLDLAALITTGPLAYDMKGSGGTVGAWRPTFTSTSSDLFLTVSSGVTSVTVNAATVTALDLIADGFSSHLLAGDPINIAWGQTISIAATTSGYTRNDWNDATRYFDLHQTNSTQATGTLHIDYSTPSSSVPEPASGLFMAMGLLLLARYRR